MTEPIHVEKSVSLYQPDLIYNYAEASREYDYVIVYEGAILFAEDVSGPGEWTKRLIDARLWGPPVFWDRSKQRVEPAIPHLPEARQVLHIARDQLEELWRRNELLSRVGREAASELYILANFAITTLAPGVARLVLEEVEHSCSTYLSMVSGGDAHVRHAADYVRRLVTAYLRGLSDQPRPQGQTAEPSLPDDLPPPARLKDLLGQMGEIHALFFLPRLIFVKEDRRLIAIRSQAKLLIRMAGLLKNCRHILICTNRAIDEQCKKIYQMAKERLKEPALELFDVEVPRRGGLYKSMRKQLNGKRVLILVADDYGKRLFCSLLHLLLDDVKVGEAHLLVVPGVKLRLYDKKTDDERMDNMVVLWEKEPIYLHEVLYLTPEEVRSVWHLIKSQEGEA